MFRSAAILVTALAAIATLPAWGGSLLEPVHIRVYDKPFTLHAPACAKSAVWYKEGLPAASTSRSCGS